MTNIDLSELTYANKKQDDFDETISRRINEPFIVTHVKWYTILLGIVGAVLTHIGELLQILPVLILDKTDYHNEFQGTLKEVTVYADRRSSTIEETSEEAAALQENETNISVVPLRRSSRVKSRKSTTPI